MQLRHRSSLSNIPAHLPQQTHRDLTSSTDLTPTTLHHSGAQLPTSRAHNPPYSTHHNDTTPSSAQPVKHTPTTPQPQPRPHPPNHTHDVHFHPTLSLHPHPTHLHHMPRAHLRRMRLRRPVHAMALLAGQHFNPAVVYPLGAFYFVVLCLEGMLHLHLRVIGGEKGGR